MTYCYLPYTKTINYTEDDQNIGNQKDDKYREDGQNLGHQKDDNDRR